MGALVAALVEPLFLCLEATLVVVMALRLRHKVCPVQTVRP